MTDEFVVRAPGRVNLIGDHTDYTGGLVLPMAIDRWTEIRGRRTGTPSISLASADEPELVELHLPIGDPSAVEPAWGRYVAGVAAELDAHDGIDGSVTTTIPVGAGLSSSAALELATAYALGWTGDAVDLAQRCRRAEQRASGVPCGIMDQLVIAAAVEGTALRIDCHTLETTTVTLPADVEVNVRFVAHRTLAGSEYADRVRECAAAEVVIGPLRLARMDAVDAIDDEVIRRRARHVVSENERVRSFVAALAADELSEAGRLMVESHRSSRDDFHTSTPTMDDAVEQLMSIPGVYGARMTGGGFGGCVVALTRPGALADGWHVHPVGAAGRVT